MTTQPNRKEQEDDPRLKLINFTKDRFNAIETHKFKKATKLNHLLKMARKEKT